jgi:hypothetical protein
MIDVRVHQPADTHIEARHIRDPALADRLEIGQRPDQFSFLEHIHKEWFDL